METLKDIPISLYQKIVLVILATCLIPLVLLSTFTLYTFNTKYTELINTQYLNEVEKSATMLEYYINTYYNILDLNYGTNSSNLLYILDNDNIPNKKLEMEKSLKEIVTSNSYIMSGFFIDETDNIYLYSRHGDKLKDANLFVKQNNYYNNIEKYDETPFIIPIHKTYYYENTERKVFTIAKKYGKHLNKGTLYIEINPSIFETVFSNIDVYGKGNLEVLDRYLKPIYQKDQYMERRAAIIAANLQQLYYSKKITSKNLTVNFSVEKVTVMTDIYVLRGFMILAILCCLVAMLIVSSKFSKQLTDPIYSIIEKMDKLKTGDFDVLIPINNKDEIGILSETFNKMSQELNIHINKSYIAHIKEKEAELTALRSQISPHFLYNTLEVIRMTAFDQNDNKVADMIESLSEQMRYIIGTVNDIVPINIEIWECFKTS